MWYNNDQSAVQQTANNLQTYLNAKLSACYTAPIFVISHLPLHYTMRTKNDGDGQYANLIFNVLNKAAEDSLNIVFLYGHDHSNGWDDYLGGAAVYLKKGDSINIAQSSKTTFKTETLNFTYMNAGFTGYYDARNTGDDATLTMTVFQFDDDELTVSRYNANGTHNLKSAGVTNSYKSERGYSPNTDVYTSPQTVILRDTNPRVTITGTSATNQGGAVLLTANAFNFEPTSYTWTSDDSSIVTIGESAGNMVSAIGTGAGSANVTVTATDGESTATATYRVMISANSAVAYTRVTEISQIESGKEYLIFFNNTKDFLVPQAATGRVGSVTWASNIDMSTKNAKRARTLGKMIAQAIGVDVRLVKGSGQMEGSYRDGVLTLDVDQLQRRPGETVQGAIMRVASHELTHFIQDKNAGDYKALKNFCFGHILEAHTQEEINRQLDAIIESNKNAGKELSPEAAIDEMVANACEQMLLNSDILSELYKQNASLAQKIAAKFTEFLDNMQQAIGSGKRSAEAEWMHDAVSELREKWNAALAVAAKNNKALGDSSTKNTATEDGATRYSLADAKKSVLKH